MGILDSFEKGLDRVVNGAFARAFRSRLEPLEVTAALRRELDTRAAVVARDRILVPNRFTLRLAPGDFERITGLGPALVDEWVELVKRHAAAQRYVFAGSVSIDLRVDRSIAEGTLVIDSVNVKGDVTWNPVVDIAGKRYPLTRSRTTIGRGSDADITVDDSGTSRLHLEILWDGSRAQVSDLGSTNGTRLNGERVTDAPLPPDSVIELGRTRVVFRVLPQSAGVDQFADLRGGPS